MKTYRLGDICTLKSGGTPNRSNAIFYNGDIPWAKIGDIQNSENGTLNKTEEFISESGLTAIGNRIFDKNTVLLAMYGSVGKTAITGTKMAINQAILGIVPKENDVLDYKYLKFWLDSQKNSLVGRARGVALQNISASIVKELQINLPPIEEQKKIVEILDQANALRQKRKKTIKLLDEYLKSIFLEMFGDPISNAKGWNTDSLENLCFTIADIDHNMPKAVETGYPFISAKDLLDNGTISFEDTKYISKSDFLRLSRKIKPQKGDIIYSRIGAKLGKARIVNVDFDFLVSYSCCTIKPNTSKINTLFLNHLLNTPFLLKHALKEVRAIGVPDLGMDKIRSFNIIVPPQELQSKFAEITQKIELLKQKMLEQSGELENQFQALMQQCFNH